VEAFERGDYAWVSKAGRELANSAPTKKVRAAARELLRRIEPEPTMVHLLFGAGALLGFLILWVYVLR
jgi:hypothetical protein